VSIEDGIEDYGAPDSEALPPGSKLLSGQYEILRYLSSGGFGITYLAKDSLNRTVVIKECFPEAFCTRVNRTVRARTQNYVDDFRSTVALFIKEAHALSKLKHPSVVGVHQVFEDHETAYMALDLIDGQDLLEVIETGMPKLPADAVRKMTLKLLSAIAHVHEQDLLHRDISPDNILVDDTGHPVLIDFGAAREEASRKSRALSAVMVVKDGYSPQEFYVAGSHQMPSSDLYALAATLAHLITGEAPPNSHARLAALASKQPDPYQPLKGRFPMYDDAFLDAIDKAMSVAPGDRIQSAEDWILRIDHTKRVELARAQAESDQSIDQTVMALVRSERMSAATARRHRAPAKMPAPQAVPHVVARQTAPQRADVAHLPVEREAFEYDRPAEAYRLEAQPNSAATAPQEEKSSPYMRVRSRAVGARTRKTAKKKVAQTSSSSGLRLQRVATVPVVFCAYFFYAQTAFQYEQVQAVTLVPLVKFGAGLSEFGLTHGGAFRSDVVVRRSLLD